MKKRLWLLAILFTILLAGIASAEFRIYIKPVTTSVGSFGHAEFELTITNTGDIEDRFRTYYSDVLWSFNTDPRTDSNIVLGAGESKTIRLIFSPRSLDLGTYVIPLNVRSQVTNELQTSSLVVNVLSDEEVGWGYYNTVIRTKFLDFKEEIDPREDLVLNVEISNLNPKNNSNLTLVVESDLFREEKEISLAGFERKQVAFNLDLDDLEKPDKYFVDAYILMGLEDGTIVTIGKAQNPGVVEIVEYGSLLKDEEIKKGFLKSWQITTITNNGNVEREELFKVETNFLKNIFQKTTPRSKQIREDRQTYHGFDVSLEPDESIEITIKTDYSILFWILVLILVIVIAYFIIRSPITITKSYANVTLKEGGISELKVMVHIRNRSIKTIENVTIVDKVPHIADIIKDFPVGTLQPTSILKHDQKGTIVKWSLDSLDGFEERILTYNIKSKLSILGGFRLPVAKARFNHLGRKKLVYSNKVISKG